ncbi:putative mitochondrial protein [Cardamine amara subsp. amara]|uniref:Mitochondrial protein n=1 Tax=Cardamine amara subsp. amara TaxID=228776 RepID=A0ABD1BLI7_CARAN
MWIEQEGGTGKYLGLPEYLSCSKSKLLAFITDNLKDHLSGWYAKTLSLEGKEILLKYVAMTLPVYAMSCFQLTKHQCEKLTSAMSSFWWNTIENKRKIHWVVWDKMCKSKQDGGLGFRDLENFNQALLAKQAWTLLQDPNSLIAKVYKSRYFLDNELLEAEIGRRPSYAWRSILHGRDLLKKGLLRVIGDGKDTLMWMDNWIMDGTPRRPFNKQRTMDLNLQVGSLISAQGTWKLEVLKELFVQEDIDRILSFPPAKSLKDSWIWAHTKEGVYKVKSGNWLVSSTEVSHSHQGNTNQLVNELETKSWKIETEPKIRLLLWRVLSGALAVAERIIAHGMQANVMCSLCRGDVESIKYVLFECVPSRKVWRNTNIPVGQ